ncbi:MAG: bifunctional 1-(5-phosphoribosyl)-5-((5-phosphoribosylamino)methylideneamino)imidazole-4-carboxamide isomerase/phosphoribosylanthranilate isomerase PriA [Actinobacteria bacterium]|nr:bifunctional 1-(5-phosphoribosyl)-5-((5-phosphoribosylamino)methylideneamino)imidazole-4-carboxamide isomerase/phosphoribosylanthranilate isomerase PriA [Actinomycetota bacterium]
MPFEVIPAIDVSGGRLCRMAIGGPAAVSEFGGDPLAAADAYVAAGARWLHVVDVDLAFTGEARNLDVLRSIAGLGASVQASGGITAAGEIDATLAAGAARAVLGSSALRDRDEAEELIDRFGDRLVVGIETEAGRIRSRRLGLDLDLDLGETIAWLAGTDAVRFLHTNVRRVGELAGPDLDGLVAVLQVGRPTIASGGVRSLDDLRAVAGTGAEGAVVGRALADGTLDPSQVFGAGRGR